ncbi:hypothetical protein [Granulicella arctica]|uniref:hypothetical protein n=1 Tax=Granulicella arctica TaxID=940613 RepID=UPI0021DF8B16|nr:hypothetical protein [Granulicella arctica]
MPNVARVLIYGLDPLLLGTRSQVLSRAGFHVSAISEMEDLYQLHAEKIKVLVLCHTIRPAEQQAAIRIGRNANPRLQTVVMTAFAPEFLAEPDARFVSAFDGPLTLIAQVRQAAAASVSLTV